MKLKGTQKNLRDYLWIVSQMAANGWQVTLENLAGETNNLCLIFIQLLGCPRLVQLLCYLVKVFMLFAHKPSVSFLLGSGFSVCKDWMQSECRGKWIKSERSKSCASCATIFNISASQSFSSDALQYLTNFRSFQKQYSDHVHVWICSQFWK